MKSIFTFLILFSFAISTFAESYGPSPSIEEQIEVSRNMPIFYGIGAAGISLGNTLEQSKMLLTPPIYGPTEQGLAMYAEGVFIQYHQPYPDSKKYPYMIVATGDYRGSMWTGKFGAISLQTKFPDYAAKKLVGAEQLTRELFNELEKIEDPSYDCLSAGHCQTIYGSEDQHFAIIVLPGAVFLMHKEEFQIAEIRIVSK